MATYDPTLLDALEGLPATAWQGRVWRHMFNEYTPDRVNTSGARWNPPGVGAIYTSLERATALAEGQHAIDSQPRRTFAKRVMYEVEVSVTDVVDLTTPAALAAVGLTLDDVHADLNVRADVLYPCQRVGGAAAWLERGGLLVPSARASGGNLVILVGTLGLDDDLEVVAHEVIEDRTGP
jgi:RES domain-containing protein